YSFEARNYEDLADGPVEVGKFDEFRVNGISPEIRVVVHGENWRKKQVEEDLRRICKYELKLMKGAPFERYTFILHFGKGAGGGGMEHSESTAIGTYSDEYLPNVAAHECFHLWNVKRIRPASLYPVYDTKGQVLGGCLDILIRDRTGNEKSLDHVLRSLNTNFAKQGKAYRDSLDVELTAENTAGGSFEEFFAKYVAGAEPFPYQQILALAG